MLPSRHAERRPALLRWLLALLLAGFAAGGSAHTLELRRGEILLDGRARPPPDAAPWAPITLPDQWIQSRPRTSGIAWYRFRFEQEHELARVESVLLPRLTMNAEVWLNGVQIGSGGSMRDPVARNWNRPLLLIAPPGLLRSGANTLHVRLVSVPYSQGSLFPPLVGPDRELRARYDRLFFVRITLNQAITLVISAVGVLLLSLWWRRRQDAMYAFAGASALVWALNSTNLYAQQVPLSSHWWEYFCNATLPVFSALLNLALLRFIGERRPLFERAQWAVMAGAPLLLALTPEPHFLTMTRSLHFAALLMVVLMTLLLSRAAARQRSLDALLLALSMWAGLAFGAHDWLMHSKLVWFADPGSLRDRDLHTVHYAAPVVFMMVGWIMTARFADVLNRFERLNAELEQRVSSKHAELESNFARLEQLTREQAMTEERQRIVADMHDGLGAQLVTALRLVESNRIDSAGIAELLRESLEDMRTVMNSMTPGEHDLDGVLGSLRYRLLPRFERAGIALDWKIDGSLPEHPLTPEAALQVQRILQECFTNILKHAGCDRIEVESGADATAGWRCIRVADNGSGIRGDHRGRGLANMHGRAARIGATLAIDSSPGGTVVTLRIPPATGGFR